MTRDIDEMKELAANNTAIGILCASMLFSMTLVVSTAIDPVITTFTLMLKKTGLEVWDYLKSAGIILIDFILAGAIAFFSIFIAWKFFLRLTKNLDEIGEMKKNNIAVALFIGAVIICFALFIQPGVKTVLDALVPFPAIQTID